MQSSLTRLGLWAVTHTSLAVVGFAVDRWFVWAVVWFVQAWYLLTIAGTVHECVHRHFVGRARVDQAIGMAAASFGFMCFEGYKAQHLAHHADACGPSDSEGEPYKFTSRWQIVGAFVGGGFLYALSVFFTAIFSGLGATPKWLRTDRQRRRIRWNVLFLLVIYGAVAAAVAVGVVSFRGVAFAWLIPASLGLLGPLPFVLMPEHYDAPGPGSPFENTRTCVSNPLLRFLYMNTNLHTAHHLKASVPWQEMEAFHAEIEDRIAPEWIFPGYLAFHRFVWQTVGRPAAHEAADPSAVGT